MVCLQVVAAKKEEAKEAPKQETTIQQEVKTDKLAHNTKDLSNDISK